MLQALSVERIEDAGAEEVRVVTANGDHYEARAVLVATGSSYRRTGAEGEDDLIGAGIHFCATCDGPFYKGSKELLVLGGGNSGLEEGSFLAQFTDQVTVVEYKDRLAGSQVLQDKVWDRPEDGACCCSGRSPAFRPEGRRERQGRHRRAREPRDRRDRGASPRRRLRVHRAGSEHGVPERVRSIWTSGASSRPTMTFMTSMPGVFAAGDVAAGSTKQLASAVGEGAAVAIQIRGYLDRQLEEAVHPGG